MKIKEEWNNDGEQWNRHSGKKRSGMVNSDSGTEEQLWWNSGTEMVEQWNRDGGPVGKLWWNRGTDMVEQ